MERYKVHFTYHNGRFDGRKGKRTVEANNKEEAGSRVSRSLSRKHSHYPSLNPRYITIDWIESLPQENK